MPNRLSVSTKTTFLALGLVTLSMPAHAGFQWVAPAEVMPAAPTPSLQPAPLTLAPSVVVSPEPPAPASAAPEIISPVIISGPSSASKTTVVTTSSDSVVTMPLAPPPSVIVSPSLQDASVPTTIGGGAQELTVVSPDAVPSLPLGPHHPESIASSSVPLPISSQSVVHGFAKNVPLAVALRQILPAGYGFSVDPDVDLGVSVSFQGGKPWDETLKAALDPAGLIYHQQGQMVVVSRSGGSPAAVTLVETPTAAPPAPSISVPPLPPESPAPAPQAQLWHVERGDSLHKILESWCHRASVELSWRAEYDYPIQASIDFAGSFEDAVRNLLVGFEDAHPQPVAELHDNKNLGQRVLLVDARGNNYGN